MANLTYTKAEPLSLRDHSGFDEAWLQQRIVDDPTILGLGNLDLIQRERISHKAGRLDLLLFDSEDNVRYEVELMLGSTDESHIIRCIEYWDIERRRYPAYDHCAVLVAENVTARFLNVIGLIAGSIPFIAIQLNALKIGDQIVLNFVRVIDRALLRTDDVGDGVSAPADRAYWNNRATPQTVEMADSIVELLNRTAGVQLHLNSINLISASMMEAAQKM